MTLNAMQPSTRKIFAFTSTGDYHAAIKDYGYIPLRTDGTPFVVQPFQGGYLLDGAPINVYIEGIWYTGQKELLQPEWDAGRVMLPPTAILNAGTAPMPPEVAANWETFSSTGLFGLSWPVILGGGFLVWKLLKR